MTLRVHGGVNTGTNLQGSLTFYHIADAGYLTADLGAVESDGSANEIEASVRVIQTKATTVLINVENGVALHVAVENGANGWTAATLQTAIRALGAPLDDAVVTETGFLLAP